jgi:hypothetical protein
VKLRPIAAALLLTLAPASFGAPNLQAQTADDPTTVAARARFKEGVALSEQGRYEDARAAFLQAYALKKHPDVLLNLADSCLKSNHVLEAERYFSQYLREATDAKAEKRQAAEKGRADARAKLGRIEVSAPSGTEVTIDSDRVGTTPLDGPVFVEAGAHTVKFKGADGATDSQSISVLAGQQRTATFGKGGATPPATTTPPTTTPPTTTPPTTTPPTDGTNTTTTTTPPGGSVDTTTPTKKSNPLAPPKNMVPVYIGGGVALVSFGVAIAVGVISKGAAQDSANKVAADIRAHNPPAHVCGPPVASSNFAAACSALTSDNNDVNTDATIGNIAIGVGVVAVIGTVIYYFAAPKKDPAETTKATAPIVTPIIGPRIGGLSVTASF